MSTWISYLAKQARETFWPVRPQPPHESLQPPGTSPLDQKGARFYEASDEDHPPRSPEEESQVRGLQEEEEEVDDGRPFDWEEPDEDDKEEEEDED